MVAAASFPAHPGRPCDRGYLRFDEIRAGQHVLNAEDRLPPDLRDVLALIR